MMKTKQLKQHINNTGDSAKFLVDALDPKLAKRFDKACRDLDKVLNDIKVDFPDAGIYVTPQVISLYIGNYDMGDSTYEGYGRYSVTKNPEFEISSNIIKSVEIIF